MKPANEIKVQVRTRDDERPRQLSPEDSLIFANSILNPKEPNEKLKALFSKDNEEILKELLAQSQKKAG